MWKLLLLNLVMLRQCAVNGQPLAVMLVHGAGSGAWCWFKLISALQESYTGTGLNLTALDLSGCGIDPGTPRNFAEYTKPLQDFMSQIPEGQKIMLVGHSAGGLSIAHASESFSRKINVAVYIAAPMSFEDFQLVPENDNMNKSSGGRSTFDKDYSRKTFYQLCSPEDFVLASMLDRPFPPFNTTFPTTPENYGTVPRVFIKTLHDKAFQPQLQDQWIARNPPNEVLSIDSDHSPFFSATSELAKLLLRIAHSYNEDKSSL